MKHLLHSGGRDEDDLAPSTSGLHPAAEDEKPPTVYNIFDMGEERDAMDADVLPAITDKKVDGDFFNKFEDDFDEDDMLQPALAGH